MWRAVHVGVRHDDDAVVAQLVDVESALARPMPVPSAVISVPISAEPSILSKRARSTFRILPFSGRIAWILARLRPCLAEPPAESPSTMNSSRLRRVRSWQSASLPGSDEMSSAPLRRVSSRALRAASRAARRFHHLAG